MEAGHQVDRRWALRRAASVAAVERAAHPLAAVAAVDRRPPVELAVAAEVAAPVAMGEAAAKQRNGFPSGPGTDGFVPGPFFVLSTRAMITVGPII